MVLWVHHFMDREENIRPLNRNDHRHTSSQSRISFMHSLSKVSHSKGTAFAACLLGILLLINNATSSRALDPSTTSSSVYFAFDVPTSAALHGRSSLEHVLRISTTDLQNIQSLEKSIQVAAFEQFDSHKTGKLYNVSVSAAPSGTFQAIRLRSGSFRRYGVNISEFTIPRGCTVDPIPQRVLLVYAQLVNNTLFQSLPGGFVLASPVLSVLVYDAATVNSTQIPRQINVSTTASLISIQFPQISNSKCAYFESNSTNVIMTDSVQGVCLVSHLGSFALVTNIAAPAPSPAEAQVPKHSNTWKIVLGSVVGGLALLGLISLLAVGIGKRRKNARLQRMEYQADQGETLQTATIGNSRVPAAADTRTQPTLENEYAV